MSVKEGATLATRTIQVVNELDLDDELKKRWDCGGEWYFGCSSNLPSDMRHDFDLVKEAYEEHVRRFDDIGKGHKPYLVMSVYDQPNPLLRRFPLMLCKTVVGSYHLFYTRDLDSSEEILITSEYIVGFPLRQGVFYDVVDEDTPSDTSGHSVFRTKSSPPARPSFIVHDSPFIF